MIRSLFGLTLVGLMASAANGAEAEPATSAGPTVGQANSVANFSLLDYRGKYYELRRTDARVVVLYFTSLNCPMARRSMGKLQALARRFNDQGVAVWLVNAVPESDPDDNRVALIADLMARGLLADVIPHDAPDAESQITQAKSAASLSQVMPRSLVLGDPTEFKRLIVQSQTGGLTILRDESQIVTHYFGVTHTCEAIALDVKNASIIYRGALDDQATPGAQKPAPTVTYLSDALTAYLAHQPVAMPQTTSLGCRITPQPEWSDRPISYRQQIAPLLAKKCVGCHSAGNIGPFAMSSYEKVKSSSAMIEEVVMDRRMPPWDADPHYGKFTNDRSLAPAEARTLLHWIEQGCPRDEGTDPLASPPPEAAAWTLGKPDFIVPLPSRQEIPAEGVLDYRYLDSDFAMPHDAWLRAAVVRPDNRKVVHHIIARVKYPADYKHAPTEEYLFTSWTPGYPQEAFPADTGVFLPKGARFNFEVHYTTNGDPQTDRSELGLYLAPRAPKMRLEVRAAQARDLAIPPGQLSPEHSSFYCFRRDALIFDVGPHMHLRGSWFKFELLYPDGNRETLLSVPHYDFNWQSGHRLAEPKRVPAGTWVVCTGGFDNRASNPANPDPTKTVRFGLQTWDEMFIGLLTVADMPGESASASQPLAAEKRGATAP